MALELGISVKTPWSWETDVGNLLLEAKCRLRSALNVLIKILVGGEGRNRTRKLYRSEPNTLCFNAYCSLILQGFKLFFGLLVHCSAIAPSLPLYCSLGEELGETFIPQGPSSAR